MEREAGNIKTLHLEPEKPNWVAIEKRFKQNPWTTQVRYIYFQGCLDSEEKIELSTQLEGEIHTLDKVQSTTKDEDSKSEYKFICVLQKFLHLYKIWDILIQKNCLLISIKRQFVLSKLKGINSRYCFDSTLKQTSLQQLRLERKEEGAQLVQLDPYAALKKRKDSLSLNKKRCLEFADETIPSNCFQETIYTLNDILQNLENIFHTVEEWQYSCFKHKENDIYSHQKVDDQLKLLTDKSNFITILQEWNKKFSSISCKFCRRIQDMKSTVEEGKKSIDKYELFLGELKNFLSYEIQKVDKSDELLEVTISQAAEGRQSMELEGKYAQINEHENTLDLNICHQSIVDKIPVLEALLQRFNIAIKSKDEKIQKLESQIAENNVSFEREFNKLGNDQAEQLRAVNSQLSELKKEIPILNSTIARLEIDITSKNEKLENFELNIKKQTSQFEKEFKEVVGQKTEQIKTLELQLINLQKEKEEEIGLILQEVDGLKRALKQSLGYRINVLEYMSNLKLSLIANSGDGKRWVEKEKVIREYFGCEQHDLLKDNFCKHTENLGGFQKKDLDDFLKKELLLAPSKPAHIPTPLPNYIEQAVY